MLESPWSTSSTCRIGAPAGWIAARLEASSVRRTEPDCQTWKERNTTLPRGKSALPRVNSILDAPPQIPRNANLPRGKTVRLSLLGLRP